MLELIESHVAPQSEMAAEPPAVAPKRTKRIAILGFGETVKHAPVNDPSWELWAMNGFWRAAKADYGIDIPEERYSLWLDTHTIEYTREYGKQAGFGDAQERWLEKEHPFPILMIDEDPKFPSVQRLPIEWLIEKLGGRDYFTSSVAYAIALAMAQDDVAEIGLFGIDLLHKTEYVDQRPCASYWLGRAEGLGIKVTTHEGSALLKQRRRYGYEPQDPLTRALIENTRKVVDRAIEAMNKNKAEMERLKCQIHTDDGARQIGEDLLDYLERYDKGASL